MQRSQAIDPSRVFKVEIGLNRETFDIAGRIGKLHLYAGIILGKNRRPLKGGL